MPHCLITMAFVVLLTTFKDDSVAHGSKPEVEMCWKTSKNPALISYLIYFRPDSCLSEGRVLSTWVVFLGSFGVGETDHGVRSQGEDKVTD